jgi:hypothetical protein
MAKAGGNNATWPNFDVFFNVSAATPLSVTRKSERITTRQHFLLTKRTH